MSALLPGEVRIGAGLAVELGPMHVSYDSDGVFEPGASSHAFVQYTERWQAVRRAIERAGGRASDRAVSDRMCELYEGSGWGAARGAP